MSQRSANSSRRKGKGGKGGKGKGRGSSSGIGSGSSASGSIGPVYKNYNGSVMPTNEYGRVFSSNGSLIDPKTGRTIAVMQRTPEGRFIAPEGHTLDPITGRTNRPPSAKGPAGAGGKVRKPVVLLPNTNNESENNNGNAKFSIPEGREAWMTSEEKHDWSTQRMEKHADALVSVRSMLQRKDQAILEALRHEIEVDRRGIANNMEDYSYKPVNTMGTIKLILKREATKRTAATDFVEIEGLSELDEYLAVADTCRTAQADLNHQIGSLKHSADGRHIVRHQELQALKDYYESEESIAMAHVKSLKHTRINTVKFSRLDRMFNGFALDLLLALRIKDELWERLDAGQNLDYYFMVQSIREVSGEDDVDIEDFDRRLEQIAHLVLAVDGLHVTSAGEQHIKETMFDIIAMLKMHIIELRYARINGAEEYAFLDFLDLRQYEQHIKHLGSSRDAYRRQLYERKLIYAGGVAVPVEVLKATGRALAASAGLLHSATEVVKQQGFFSGIARLSASVSSSVRQSVTQGTEAVLKRCLQPVYEYLKIETPAEELEMAGTNSVDESINERLNMGAVKGAIYLLRQKIQEDDDANLAAFDEVAGMIEQQFENALADEEGLEGEAYRHHGTSSRLEALVKGDYSNYQATLQRVIANKRKIKQLEAAEMRQQDEDKEYAELDEITANEEHWSQHVDDEEPFDIAQQDETVLDQGKKEIKEWADASLEERRLELVEGIQELRNIGRAYLSQIQPQAAAYEPSGWNRWEARRRARRHAQHFVEGFPEPSEGPVPGRYNVTPGRNTNSYWDNTAQAWIPYNNNSAMMQSNNNQPYASAGVQAPQNWGNYQAPGQGWGYVAPGAGGGGGSGRSKKAGKGKKKKGASRRLSPSSGSSSGSNSNEFEGMTTYDQFVARYVPEGGTTLLNKKWEKYQKSRM